MLGLHSCKTRENLVYFQHSDQSDTTKHSNFTFIFKPGDIVSINVSSIDAEAVKPFNTDYGLKAGPDGYTTGNAARDGYLLDASGAINFPVLGAVKLGGLSRNDAIDTLVNRLKVYVDDPIVNLRVTNFKVTVLGSVSHPGTFTVPNERITIFEAFGLSEDLKITGKRQNVVVIRENNGIKKEIRLDLTSQEVFNSPAYYLQQNDIVYVEPNPAERYSSSFFKTSSSVILSAVSIMFTSYAIFIK